jgi:hypothetical protein
MPPRPDHPTFFRRLRDPAAFTLIETMMAVLICGAAITMFFVATGHALHVAKTGRDISCASEILQERVEFFRGFTSDSPKSSWESLLTQSKLAALPDFSTSSTLSSEVQSTLPNATQTFTVSDSFPSGGGLPGGGTGLSYTVTVSPGGTITTSGSDLSAAQRCVCVTATVTWLTDTGGAKWVTVNGNTVTHNLSRSITTIITKNGLSP